MMDMENQLPEVRIVPIEKLVPHEMEDSERTKRIEMRIRVDGALKNPVIVGKIRRDGPKLLLLDGVHRVNALKRLGCRDVVAQVIDYRSNDVKVFTWHHLIQGFEVPRLLKSIRGIKDIVLEKVDRERAEALLKEKKIVCYFLFKNGDVFVVKCEDDLKTRTLKLRDVVDVYKRASEIYRLTKSEADFLLKESKDAIAVLSIPVYDKREIEELAFNGINLPAGITRHVVSKRVLGLHIDLALLKVDMSLKSKNKILKEIIKERIANKRARFYPESVFVFDE